MGAPRFKKLPALSSLEWKAKADELMRQTGLCPSIVAAVMVRHYFAGLDWEARTNLEMMVVGLLAASAAEAVQGYPLQAHGGTQAIKERVEKCAQLLKEGA